MFEEHFEAEAYLLERQDYLFWQFTLFTNV